MWTYFFDESAVISPSPFSTDLYLKFNFGKVLPSTKRFEGVGESLYFWADPLVKISSEA